MLKKFFASALVGLIAIPAYGQSTRTLDGDFITRNYGERNYVKNPGAEVNAGDNVSTGTGSPIATRSTTTPLVGSGDFAVDLKQTVDNRSTWSLNAFDNALSGQNCQASFVVDNVVVGTGAVLKARVIQNSLSVGEVTIASGTAKQPYSINFPCGDLSNATTFETRLTTGGSTDTTFNIDDIRVGKPVNLAQVGQAEFTGGIEYPRAPSCAWNHSTTSFADFTSDTDCMGRTLQGSATGPADSVGNRTPSVTFSTLKPGRYYVIATFTGRKIGATDSSIAFRLSDGTNSGTGVLFYPGTNTYFTPTTAILDVEYTTTQSNKTFSVQGLTNSGANSVAVDSDSTGTGLSIKVYRYPLASELAITPSQQSTYGAVTWSATNTASAITAATWTSFNNAIFASSNASYVGAATALTTGTCGTTNDLGVCMPTLAPGAYKVTFNGSLYVEYSASSTYCNFSLYDGTNRTAAVDANAITASEIASNNTLVGYFNYSSVQTNKSFVVQAVRQSGGGNCKAAVQNTANAQRTPLFIIEKIDGPNANQSVYVQSPMKAAGTGTAVDAGYVGYLLSATSASSVNQGSPGNGTFYDITSMSLPLTPGRWRIMGSVPVRITGASGSIIAGQLAIRDGSNTLIKQTGSYLDQVGATTANSVTFPQTVLAYVTVTSNTTYKLSMKYTLVSGSAASLLAAQCDLGSCDMYAELISDK